MGNDGSKARGGDPWKKVKLIAALVATGLLVTLMFQNKQGVVVELLFWDLPELALSLLLLIAFAIGAAAGLVSARFWRRG